MSGCEATYERFTRLCGRPSTMRHLSCRNCRTTLQRRTVRKAPVAHLRALRHKLLGGNPLMFTFTDMLCGAGGSSTTARDNLIATVAASLTGGA